MLPSDVPFLETALALSALPFRPVTVGCLFQEFLGTLFTNCTYPTQPFSFQITGIKPGIAIQFSPGTHIIGLSCA